MDIMSGSNVHQWIIMCSKSLACTPWHVEKVKMLQEPRTEASVQICEFAAKPPISAEGVNFWKLPPLPSCQLQYETTVKDYTNVWSPMSRWLTISVGNSDRNWGKYLAAKFFFALFANSNLIHEWTPSTPISQTKATSTGINSSLPQKQMMIYLLCPCLWIPWLHK